MKQTNKNKCYNAYFKANDSTYNQEPITGTNKSKLIRDIRLIAEGNRFANNSCSWSVHTDDGRCIAAGGVSARNQRWRATTSDLWLYDILQNENN